MLVKGANGSKIRLSMEVTSQVLYVFSSAADIVIGAFPILSQWSFIIVVRHHPSSLFSNQIGSLSFYLIFPIFGFDVHNNITPKHVGLEFWFLALNFLIYILMIKNR